MNHSISPALFLFALGFVACGENSTNEDPPGQQPPVPMNTELPYQVAATLSGETASELLSPSGGVVEVRTTEGLVFRLVVPPGALSEEVLISAGPVVALEGLPDEAMLLAAAQFGPSGLEFEVPARLEIVLPEGQLPTQGVEFIGWNEETQQTYTLSGESGSTGWTIDVNHFSGAAVVVSFVSRVSQALIDAGPSGPFADVVDLFEAWHLLAIRQLNAPIPAGVRTTHHYEAGFFQSELWMASLYLMPDNVSAVQRARLTAMEQRLDLAKAARAVLAINQANEDCVAAHDLDFGLLALAYYADAQVRALHEIDPTLDRIHEVLRCVEVKFTQPMVPGDLGPGDRGPISAHITVQFTDGVLFAETHGGDYQWSGSGLKFWPASGSWNESEVGIVGEVGLEPNHTSGTPKLDVVVSLIADEVGISYLDVYGSFTFPTIGYELKVETRSSDADPWVSFRANTPAIESQQFKVTYLVNGQAQEGKTVTLTSEGTTPYFTEPLTPSGDPALLTFDANGEAFANGQFIPGTCDDSIDSRIIATVTSTNASRIRTASLGLIGSVPDYLIYSTTVRWNGDVRGESGIWSEERQTRTDGCIHRLQNGTDSTVDWVECNGEMSVAVSGQHLGALVDSAIDVTPETDGYTLASRQSVTWQDTGEGWFRVEQRWNLTSCVDATLVVSADISAMGMRRYWTGCLLTAGGWTRDYNSGNNQTTPVPFGVWTETSEVQAGDRINCYHTIVVNEWVNEGELSGTLSLRLTTSP